MIHVTLQSAPCYCVCIDWSLSQEPSAKKARRPLSKVIANKLRDSPLKQARNSIKVRGACIPLLHVLYMPCTDTYCQPYYTNMYMYIIMCTILVRVSESKSMTLCNVNVHCI